MVSQRDLRLALVDLAGILTQWRIWYQLGLNEIWQRYRRSTLGPFWLTMSMGVQAATMGFLFGFLFNQTLDRFLPFLCISLVLWNFLIATVNEGAYAFLGASGLIMQVKRSLSVHVMQTIWRNIIIVGHTIIIFFIVAALFGIFPTWHYLAAIPGLLLFIFNICWLSFLSAILSARFRDIPMIIQNAFTVLFWLTPILYMPSQLGGTVEYVVMMNPLTHVFEVARQPLLQQMPTTLNWIVATGMALLGAFATLLLFGRSRSRIPYWI